MVYRKSRKARSFNRKIRKNTRRGTIRKNKRTRNKRSRIRQRGGGLEEYQKREILNTIPEYSQEHKTYVVNVLNSVSDNLLEFIPFNELIRLINDKKNSDDFLQWVNTFGMYASGDGSNLYVSDVGTDVDTDSEDE